MSTELPGTRSTSTYAGSAATEELSTPPRTDDRPDPAPGGERTRAGARAAARPPERQGAKPPPRRKRKARKVHRVVRHLDVWSIAKVTAVFVACGYAVGMISGYLLWQAADRVGTIDGIEGFIESSAAYDSFQILGGVVFRVAAVTGLVLAIVVLAMAVLGALLFNLVSDLTGGIRMTVIDEDLIVAPARRPTPRPDAPPQAYEPG
jgi:hypothetical protein